MPGRNRLKNWLNQSFEIPVYFRELFDVLLSYTGLKGSPLVINDTEDGVNTSEFSAEIFNVAKLAGFGTSALAKGDGTLSIAHGLVPFLDTVGDCYFIIYNSGFQGRWRWTAGGGAGLKSTIPALSADGGGEGDFWLGTSGTNWTSFANVPTGYYTICLPGTTGRPTRMWYDETKVTAALTGSSTKVYVDKAGCMWKEGATWARGEFICGPTVVDGHGKNMLNSYADDTNPRANVIGFAPMKGSGNASIEVIGAGEYGWYYASVGDAVAINGIGWAGVYTNVPGFYLVTATNWDTFADVSPGLKEIQLKYYDGANVVDGTKILMYYDRTKLIKYFSGNQANAYIDMLGNIWKGNPESGGVFVCGPYESSGIFDERHTKLKISSNDTTEDYLINKLTETANIKLIEINDGGDEGLEVKATRLPVWDSTYEYAENDHVVYSDKIYKAIHSGAGNTNKTPSSETAYWELATGKAGNGTISTGNTEVAVVIVGEYNRAAVSAVGLNATQRTPQVKSIAYSVPNTTVTVMIGSSYVEDIVVHVIVSRE